MRRRCVHSYTYNTVLQVFQNDTVNIAACLDPLKTEDVPPIEVEPTVDDKTGKQVSADKAKYIYIDVKSGSTWKDVAILPRTWICSGFCGFICKM